jgi:hypothetical protein
MKRQLLAASSKDAHQLAVGLKSLLPEFGGMENSRRELLLWGSAAGGLFFGGCVSTPTEGLPAPHGGFGPPVVDAHCHTFNAKDLSPARFLRYAFLELYPGPNETLSVSGVEDRDVFDGVIEALLGLVGASLAPTAKAELAYLNRRTGGDPAALHDAEQDAQTTARLAAFLKDRPPAPPQDEEVDYRQRGRALVYFGVLESVGAAAPVSGRLDAVERQDIADRFVRGAFERTAEVSGRSFDLWQALKWISLFRRYRHVLVDDLTLRHRSAGWNPVLLTPAMVDFARFVREEPASPLADQAKVWARIAKLPGGPAVHGYMAFCPLRQALHLHSVHARLRAGPEPLALIREALTVQGFLGVKLYPPMGFQAVDNVGRDLSRYPFSDDVLRDRFGDLPLPRLRAAAADLAREIDEALGGLYDLCSELDAPIMAHGGPGNAIKRYYGELSDPWLWRPLFETPRHRPLRIMLAHYGSFKDPSIDPAGLTTAWPDPETPIPIPRTKEAAILRYLRAAQAQSGVAPTVAVDMSMFAEAIEAKGPARTRIVSAFGEFVRNGGEDHIVFGTDWTMLGLVKGERGYDAAVRDFLTEAGLTDAQITKALGGNFIRFAGLARGGASRRRLDAFNASYGQPDRLAALDN